MAGNSAIKDVLNMKRQGKNNDQIMQNLKNKYGGQEISDAMTQADIKSNVEGDEIPSPGGMETTVMEQDQEYNVPEETAMPEATIQQPQVDISGRIHEISEAIVNEKWDEFISKIGDIGVWKERVNSNIISIKQEIIRIEERFDNLEKAVLGKVSDYGKGIEGIHTEMKALEKVFERILDPLITNVKELERITVKLKGKK